MSWKPAFTIGSEKNCTNGQSFATKEEAEKSAHSRFNRWTMPSEWYAIESSDPVSYQWIDGQGDVRLPD